MAEPTDNSARYKAFDKDARNWIRKTEQELKRQLLRLSLGQRIDLNRKLKSRATGELVEGIKGRIKRRYGEVEYLGFSFERYGIFYEHGVGKNRPIGSAAARKAARPWLKPVLDPAIEELADILEERYADIIAGELRVLIPGIIDTRIKIN